MKKAKKFSDWCYKTLPHADEMLAELDKQEVETE